MEIGFRAVILCLLVSVEMSELYVRITKTVKPRILVHEFCSMRYYRLVQVQVQVVVPKVDLKEKCKAP